MDDLYLIWSHEHGAWWGPERCGYVRRISDAGRYSRADAWDICIKAMSGTSTQLGALPELPVRLADVDAMTSAYDEQFPDRPEAWR